VTVRRNLALTEALALVAPGQPLREGLDRILKANRGALVIVGDDPSVLAVCSGGFLLDAEFSPQRLSELAKMDGAIIMAADTSRIARANVHLMPESSIPTSETGTRHRTAERVARSVDVPVVSVSASMSTIAMYRNEHKHSLQPIGWLRDRATQALATLQRFRSRFDVALAALSAHEVEDTVSVRDVVEVLQAGEMVARIADEVEGYLVELGEDGRLVRLQLGELSEGVEQSRRLVVRDYVRTGGKVSAAQSVDTVFNALQALSTDDLLEVRKVMAALGMPASAADPHAGLEPRGYRLLSRLPRFSEAVIDRIVGQFSGLQQILRASVTELEQVGGIGESRARSVKSGLARLAEASIFERYD